MPVYRLYARLGRHGKNLLGTMVEFDPELNMYASMAISPAVKLRHTFRRLRDARFYKLDLRRNEPPNMMAVDPCAPTEIVSITDGCWVRTGNDFFNRPARAGSRYAV